MKVNGSLFFLTLSLDVETSNSLTRSWSLMAIFFDVMFWKMKRFSLNVEALSMHVPALVKLVYAILNSDIPFESCTYKHMKALLKGTQKVVLF